MKILFVASEAAPFAKVGGLGDVAGALPKALRALGHDVRVVMPHYGQVDPRYQLVALTGDFGTARVFHSVYAGVPIYFVNSSAHFERGAVYGFDDDVERFLVLCHAALAIPQAIGWIPDVVHCHDWHTAAIPLWMRTGAAAAAAVASAASVLTIHNIAYQGDFDPTLLADWIDPGTVLEGPPDRFTMLAQGIRTADLVTTVSERYAEEITTPAYGEGLDPLLTSKANQLRGIVNGIDYELFDPEHDRALAQTYSSHNLIGKQACKLALQQEAGFDVGPRRPLIGVVSRLADQKGVDLMAETIESFLDEVDVQLVLLGTGEPRYHDLFRLLAARRRRQLAVYLTFDEELAQRIYAGADMFLMPSRFEPCGLGQLIALRYGTVPVVRATGGLADTVKDYQPSTRRGTGFVFRNYTGTAMCLALARALEIFRQQDRWSEIQQQGMLEDHSWAASAVKYVDTYEEALRWRSARSERPAL